VLSIFSTLATITTLSSLALIFEYLIQVWNHTEEGRGPGFLRWENEDEEGGRSPALSLGEF
jgi:hypothetical protein